MNNEKIFINLVKIRSEIDDLVNKLKYLSGEIDLNVSCLIENYRKTSGSIKHYNCCNNEWTTEDESEYSSCASCGKLVEPYETVNYVE